MVELTVDHKKIGARPGRTVLAACLENGIFVPNLCFLETDTIPTASCRLCFVEISGTPAPVPSCTVMVASGLEVRTDTPAVRRLQRSALKLLLSAHHVDCKHCHANRACALQSIAAFLKVGLNAKPLELIPRSDTVDQRHPVIDHYPHRCVLCGKCVRICGSLGHRSVFTFSGRGIDTVIQHYPAAGESPLTCPECRRCVEICPVGAMAMRDP
jgi:bidirectional [NiFe] hydrogenase diaphorase subunit